MIRVRIVQCLCGPARHAIFAMALGPETPDITDAQATSGVRLMIAEMVAGRGAALDLGLPPQLNPWCGICGTPMRDWVYELGRSKPFADWEAAQRALNESADAQHATKFLLDLLDKSFDARVRNPGGPIN